MLKASESHKEEIWRNLAVILGHPCGRFSKSFSNRYIVALMLERGNI